MKKCLSALVIISLLIAALPALAQDETLDKTMCRKMVCSRSIIRAGGNFRSIWTVRRLV